MPFHVRQPSMALAPFVQLLWLMEGEQPAHAMERVLPDGFLELVINLREDVIRVYDPRSPQRFETRRGGVMEPGRG